MVTQADWTDRDTGAAEPTIVTLGCWSLLTVPAVRRKGGTDGDEG
jgi:hypothetical protein